MHVAEAGLAEGLGTAWGRQKAVELLDDALLALSDLRQDGYAAITPAERPHSIATLADVAVRLGAAEAGAELAALLRPWSGLVVFDSSNGPLEPVDDYLARLASDRRAP